MKDIISCLHQRFVSKDGVDLSNQQSNTNKMLHERSFSLERLPTVDLSPVFTVFHPAKQINSHFSCRFSLQEPLWLVALSLDLRAEKQQFLQNERFDLSCLQLASPAALLTWRVDVSWLITTMFIWMKSLGFYGVKLPNQRNGMPFRSLTKSPLQVFSVLVSSNLSFKHKLWRPVLPDGVHLHRRGQHRLHRPASLPLCLRRRLCFHLHPQKAPGPGPEGASSELRAPQATVTLCGPPARAEPSRLSVCHVWQQ